MRRSISRSGSLVDPDEAVLDRYELELVAYDEEEDEVRVGSALLFRVHPFPSVYLDDAADAESDSALLEEVLLNAVDEDGMLKRAFSDETEGYTAWVLDKLAFRHPNDVPLTRGLLARTLMENLLRSGDVLFLPREDAALWERAVGATEVGDFIVTSADWVLPMFPIGVVPGEDGEE